MLLTHVGMSKCPSENRLCFLCTRFWDVTRERDPYGVFVFVVSERKDDVEFFQRVFLGLGEEEAETSQWASCQGSGDSLDDREDYDTVESGEKGISTPSDVCEHGPGS